MFYGKGDKYKNAINVRRPFRYLFSILNKNIKIILHLANLIFTSFITIKAGIMKITWNPKDISKNPRKSYDNFCQVVMRATKKKNNIEDSSFYAVFKTFAETYEQNRTSNEFLKLSRNLIEFLVNQKQERLAGIAYSLLIKFNHKNQIAVENLALKGLAIATRAKDPVHMFARARDLVELYEKTEPGSNNHIKYLRIANKALKDLCQNYYTTAELRFNRISRDLKPLENYEFIHCLTKLDIIKYTYRQDLPTAKNELELAKNLLEKNKNSKNVDTLKILTKKIAYCETLLCKK